MKHSWKLILATLTIFGAGVFAGCLLNGVSQPQPANASQPPAAIAATNRPATEHPAEQKARPPEFFKQEFVRKLDDALQLTPAQHEAIQKIIACGQEQNHAISTNCSAQYRQVLLEVKQHIREQLTPDQRKEFENLLKQMHAPAKKTAPATNAPVTPAP